MPIIFQHSPQDKPLLAVWKITEPSDFFGTKVPTGRTIAHPQVQLRHLAARYVLAELQPGFPYHQIEITSLGKPYLPNSTLQFSLTHCGDYAAAILSQAGAVGIDLEERGDRIFRIRHKFLSDEEQELIRVKASLADLQGGLIASEWLTRAWSAKESIYKWHGEGSIDFSRDIVLKGIDASAQQLQFNFTPTGSVLHINYRSIEQLELTWIAP